MSVLRKISVKFSNKSLNKSSCGIAKYFVCNPISFLTYNFMYEHNLLLSV